MRVTLRSVCTISYYVADPRPNGLSAPGDHRVYRRLLIQTSHPERETAQGAAAWRWLGCFLTRRRVRRSQCVRRHLEVLDERVGRHEHRRRSWNVEPPSNDEL
jgi:hypothetical protein